MAATGHKKRRRVLTVDCETDPFKNGRVPEPFIWGVYDPEGPPNQNGEHYHIFFSTDEFVDWLKRQKCYAYAHNGGKFDFIYLLPYVEGIEKIRIIGGRIAELKFGEAILRDSYSLVQCALAEIQKGEIDYRFLEASVRAEHMPEIIDYLKIDVHTLYLMVTEFRRDVGVGLTIGANAFANMRKIGIEPGRSHHAYDRKFREFFFGGRTQCFQAGTHREIAVFDIRSSYPYAMSQKHPTGMRAHLVDIETLTNEEIGPCFITLECYSDGAFPIRDEKNHSVEFPKAFGTYNITGWEYLIAKKHGLVRNARILAAHQFLDQITFAPYVEKWFAYKEANRPRRTVEERAKYTIGKRMANAGYGKLAMNPLGYYDYKICEEGELIETDYGWHRYVRFQGREIHRRSVRDNLEYCYGKEWEKRPIFYNVATAASITGLARANLLDAIMTVGRERVVYCDTDSIAVKGYERPAGLDYSEKLGAWDCEGEFQIGHFAGKKLYGLKSRFAKLDAKKSREVFGYKIACKGSKLKFREIFAIVNEKERRARAEKKGREFKEIVWKSQAPTFSIAKGGSIRDAASGKIMLDAKRYFVQRRIRATGISIDRPAKNKRGPPRKKAPIEFEFPP